jgi:hypothetical protein
MGELARATGRRARCRPMRAWAGMAVMRFSGLALQMGTKVWPRRFRADARCGVANAKEISYVKDSHSVHFK